jgi:P pilus assembly chaperone PapD
MRLQWGQGARLIAAVFCVFSTSPVLAAGDLLVAPTRIVLDGSRGTEVILNNIGAEPATYRISLELRRMLPDGTLEEIDQAKANDHETTTLGMISYAPRRVVLPPNQPQSIRIGVRAPQGLPDGEYRAHMLFRAIPDAKPVVDDGKPKQGVSISLTPIYGVTIPVIVRQGSLSATAALADPKIVTTEDGPAFQVSLSRNGTRSVYGRIRVTKPGVDKPVMEARGIAVYAELGQRLVTLPVDEATAAQLKGPVKVEYLEDQDAGGGMIASIQAVIR